MKFIRLAWRNVFRHPRRTVITSAAISIGLAAMIYMDTLMNGLDDLAVRNILDYESSHLEVFSADYKHEPGFFPLDALVSKSIINRVKNQKGVAGVTGRIKFQTNITNGADELPILGIGVDRAKEDGVFQTPKAVVKGYFIKTEYELVIGSDLAKDLEIDTGALVTLIVRDKNGAFNAFDFTVVGIMNTSHPLLDRNAVIIPLSTAQRLLAFSDDEVTELCIRLTDSNKIESIKIAINGVLGSDYQVLSYRELNRQIFEISGVKRSGQFFTALIVVIIAAVGIINTMLMAVMERIPEIGTLKAMGFSNSVIMRLFLYEGGIIGAFGSLLGVILGLVFSLHLVYYGWDLSSMFENIDIIYPTEFYIKGAISPITVLFVFFFGVFVSVIVTLWPVRRATRLNPVDALRYV